MLDRGASMKARTYAPGREAGAGQLVGDTSGPRDEQPPPNSKQGAVSTRMASF